MSDVKKQVECEEDVYDEDDEDKGPKPDDAAPDEKKQSRLGRLFRRNKNKPEKE